VAVKDVTFDTSYPTGGEAINAVDFGLRAIRFGLANIKTTAAAGGAVDVVVIPQSDGNALLKVNAAAAEVANATSLATLVATVICWGDV
jgi:hypothetical protein